MRKLQLSYFSFTIILILAILLLPTFFLSDVIAVILAVICITRVIHRMSVLVLGLIVAIVTIAWPVFMLCMIGKNSTLSLLAYMHIRNVLAFLTPTIVLIVMVIMLKNYLPNAKQ